MVSTKSLITRGPAATSLCASCPSAPLRAHLRPPKPHKKSETSHPVSPLESQSAIAPPDYFLILPSNLLGSASNLPLHLLQQNATSAPLCLLVIDASASLPLTGQTVFAGAAEATPAAIRLMARKVANDFIRIGFGLGFRGLRNGVSQAFPQHPTLPYRRRYFPSCKAQPHPNKNPQPKPPQPTPANTSPPSNITPLRTSCFCPHLSASPPLNRHSPAPLHQPLQTHTTHGTLKS